MSIDFFAMMHRMRYIQRWGLMRNQIAENVQEHSHEVAVLAHLLAVIRQTYVPEGRLCPEPATVAVYGLFHDATEILTGDMPTPAKYFSTTMRQTYGELEAVSANHLLSMLPDPLRARYAPYLEAPADDEMSVAIAEIVKAADRLAALIKCCDELSAGNEEFRQASATVQKKLDEMALPEVTWFMRHVYPSYQKSVDELRGSLDSVQ